MFILVLVLPAEGEFRATNSRQLELCCTNLDMVEQQYRRSPRCCEYLRRRILEEESLEMNL